MSKQYRSAWNEAMGAWVAIAEIEGSNDTGNAHNEIIYKTDRPIFTLSRLMQATTLGLLASSAAYGITKFTTNELKHASSSHTYPTLSSQALAADLKAPANNYKIRNYSYADKRKSAIKIVFSPIDTTFQTYADQFLTNAIAYFNALAVLEKIQREPKLALELNQPNALNTISFSPSRVTGQASMDGVENDFNSVSNVTVADNHDFRIIVADSLFLQGSDFFNTEAVLNKELSIQNTLIDFS